MNHIKKFNENADHEDWGDGIDWSDAIENTAIESKLFDNKDTSIFTDILDGVFNQKFRGTYPSKDEVKAALMNFCDESIDESLSAWDIMEK